MGSLPAKGAGLGCVLLEHSGVPGQQSCGTAMESWGPSTPTGVAGLLRTREEAFRGRNKEAKIKGEGLCSLSYKICAQTAV